MQGTVYLAGMMAPSVGSIIGMDGTPAMLTRAGEKMAQAGYRHVSFKEGMAEELPLATGSVDVAMCHMLLHHVVSPRTALANSVAEEIHRHPVDIYCPCSLGAVLNEQTIPELRCQIVCGAANNQLADEYCCDLLAQNGILYAPDYLVNASGMIAYAESRHPGGFDRQRALVHISRIYDTLERVFAIAREQPIPTSRAADQLAEQRIASVRQAKTLATAP